MKQTNDVKAVIFDVGGVLIVTHNRAGREKWGKRLGMDAWEFENFVFNGESGRQAQLGQKSNESHWAWLGEQLGLQGTDLIQMRRDFFAGDKINQPLVDTVQRLRQAGYKTGILSNFGDNARQLWRDVYPFIDYFDGIIISAEVGLMKPDARIYRMAADSVGVTPEEAVFIDDFIENIEGASAVGMRGIHFTDTATVLQELRQLTKVE
jgi:epoxide hydrolase-like predicted phosphatase